MEQQTTRKRERAEQIQVRKQGGQAARKWDTTFQSEGYVSVVYATINR